MTVPSNIDFATEVKTDRLRALYKLASIGSVIILSFAFFFISVVDEFPFHLIVAPLMMIGACWLTHAFLIRDHFKRATWAFSLGAIAALGSGLFTTDPSTLNTLPFAFVIVVFVAGLLMAPLHSLLLAVIASGTILFVPALVNSTFMTFGGYQFFAVMLVFISAGLAMQVTGELYAVTEWALANYKRERRTNNDLFESRQALERSLKRSEALGERLKQMNTELESARTAAESAKNFRGQFLANMSHELRTPLNAIIGFSETMRRFPVMYDDVQLPTPYQADMDQIFNSGKHLLNLINDILDLAKIDAGKLDVTITQVDLAPIVKSTLSIAKGLIGSKPIAIQTDIPDPMPAVLGDENRVRQILLNLYSNAIKFSDSGRIQLMIKTIDDEVQFSISDTGMGIAPENLQLIFEEFKQGSGGEGRDPRAGAGLGLAISRQLTTLMNGRIWAESAVGKGSIFHFTLPLYNEDELDDSGEVLLPQEAAG